MLWCFPLFTVEGKTASTFNCLNYLKPKKPFSHLCVTVQLSRIKEESFENIFVVLLSSGEQGHHCGCLQVCGGVLSFSQ